MTNIDFIDCKRCELSNYRINVVWSRLDREADLTINHDLMIIGEAPGQTEDELGLPFVGDSGQMLEMMLRSINMTSHDFYITNLVKCRPLHNRKPKSDEIKACSNHLYYQIETVNPKLIICLGNVPSQFLIDKKFAISRDRGKVYTRQLIPNIDTEFKLIATYHPSYLLRNNAIGSGSKKEQSWQDLIKIKSLIDEIRKF